MEDDKPKPNQGGTRPVAGTNQMLCQGTERSVRLLVNSLSLQKNLPVIPELLIIE